MQPEYKYWYIVFTNGMMGFGNTILKQSLPSSGEPDNGFNHASSTQMLMERFQTPIVIINYYETNKARYDQWQDFLLDGIRKFPFIRVEPQALGIIQGGNEKGLEPKSAPALSIIKKPEDDPK